MGLDSVSTEIYAIHGYFRGLTVRQRTPEFLGCHKMYKFLLNFTLLHIFHCKQNMIKLLALIYFFLVLLILSALKYKLRKDK